MSSGGSDTGRPQNGSTPMNNQEQNRQTKAAAREAGLNKSQARELHDRVHGQGMDYQQILSEAMDIKDRRKGDKPWKQKHGK